MGLLDRFKKKKETEGNKKSDRIPSSLSIDGESITFRIAKMKQVLIAIQSAFPEKAQPLKTDIETIEKEIAYLGETPELVQIFQGLEQRINDLKQATSKYQYFNEVKFLQKDTDNLFWGQIDGNPTINNFDYDKLNTIYDELVKHTSLYHGEQLEAYKVALNQISYRLRCCQMLLANINHSGFSNLFQQMPENIKILYGNFLTSDLEQLSKELSLVRYNYSLAKQEKDVSSIQSDIDNFAEKIGMDYMQDFQINGIFDNDDLMQTFIGICQLVRDEKTNFSKNIKKIKQEELERQNLEEQERQQQKLQEKMKNLSPEEIEKQIQDFIDNNLDITQNYRTILAFQLAVAKLKGYISSKNTMQIPDAKIIRVSQENLGLIIQNAKEKGINCTLLCDVDDKESKNHLLVSVKNKINALQEMADKLPSNQLIPGKYGNSFAKFLISSIPVKERKVSFHDHYIYATDPSETKVAIKQLFETYQKILAFPQKSEDIANIKFYIEFPYTRTFIPILEKLQHAGIDYYFPPIDEHTIKHQPTIKLYMDRNNFKKYKEQVHSQISTKELGEIHIHLEQIDLTKLLLSGNSIPCLQEEEQQRKQIKEFQKMSEREMAKAIKQIADNNFDVTNSYKHILEYEKQVGIARGLLTNKSLMSTDDIEFFRTTLDSLWIVIQKAKEKGYRCTYLPTIDENPNSNVLVGVTKGKKKEIEPIINPDIKLNSSSLYYNELSGIYKPSFIECYHKLVPESKRHVKFSSNGKAFYSVHDDYAEKTIESHLQTFYNAILSTSSNPQDVVDIKVSLQIPYLRPLIPILETLQTAGIEYYLPPIDDQTRKTEETKQIYIDRKNLTQYLEKVHSQISTLEKGIVTIGSQSISTQDLILEGTEIPFLKNKEKNE